MRFITSIALTVIIFAIPALSKASTPVSPLTTAQDRGYAVYVTGEGAIQEGDLEAAREAAKAAASREALEKTLQEELGTSLVEGEKDRIQQLFLDPHEDFITRAELISERQTGSSLFAVFAVYPHIPRLRTVITNSQLADREEDEARITVIWAEESRDLNGEDRQALPTFRTASWSAAVTEPTALPRLLEELKLNELNVVPPNTDILEWAAQALDGQEVDKAFLRELGTRMEVDHVVFLRLVRRAAPTPKAARQSVARVNHVAFLFDVASGELLEAPTTASVTARYRSETDAVQMNVPREWLQQIVAALSHATAQPRTVVAVHGLHSVREFDGMWRRLRHSPGLGNVAPSRIQSNFVELELLGDRPVEEWARLIARALPEAVVETQRGEISIRLPGQQESAPPETTPESVDTAE